MNLEDYCEKCGNTGTIFETGARCDCTHAKRSAMEAVSCLAVPKQYARIVFDKFSVNKDIGDDYPNRLQELYDSIVTNAMIARNVLICAPPKHSKTVFACSCITELFNYGVEVASIYDLLEVRKIISDMEFGYNNLYEEFPDKLIKAPYLFVKVPRVVNKSTYDIILYLMDKRLRRGGSTIYLYDGTYEELVVADKRGLLKDMKGDGYYKSLQVYSWESVNSTYAPLPDEQNL